VRPFVFLIAFAAAIWAIGEGWAALREAWDAPTGSHVAAVLGYLAVFIAAFVYLGFGVYAADRAAGKVRRPIGLYERLLARRPGRGPGQDAATRGANGEGESVRSIGG
jgi:hypothetical protein